MINIPVIPSSSKIRTEVIPDITKTWKIGQVLNATAERNANAQANVLMRMGQTILEAKTPIALKAGDPLKLLVKSLGDRPVLTIQTAAVQRTSTTRIAAQNLKSFIAQQHNLTGLLQLSQKVIDSPTLPNVLKQQLNVLNLQLPSAEQATQAKTLKKMIQNSGIFLESRLKHPQAGTLRHDDLQQDIKSQLLKISAQLKSVAPELTTKPPITTTKNLQLLINQFIKGDINLLQFTTLLTNQLPKSQLQLIQQALATADKPLLPTELLSSFTMLLKHIHQQVNPRQIQDNLSGLLKTMDLLQQLKTNIDGALAKITSQQLMTLTREADSSLLLLFDLILTDKKENHLIQFRMEQEKLAKDKNNSSWIVSLNFEFKELGPIQARLHLSNNKMSTVFRAEKASTVDNISQQINLLDAAFRDIGFDIINLDVNQGNINQPRDLPESIHILDEEA